MNNLILTVLILVAACLLVSFLKHDRKAKVVRGRSYRVRRFTVMERLMAPFVIALRPLSSAYHKVWNGGDRVALANTLGLINEHGIESLIIDPGQSFPIGGRFLLYERGSAAQYAQLALGVNPPLGPSSDAPFQANDILNVRRLGCRPGLELGIPGSAITIDHIICCAKDGSGKVLDLTLQGNGTYWVVGRAVMTVAATDLEVAYVPDIPYQITVSGGGGTYAYAGAGL